jgi:SAM-dependent methyltransferase
VAHDSQHAFFEHLRAVVPGFFTGTRVGEVGSLDINGSIRGLFSDGEYVGFDVGEGPGVDVVCEGQLIGAPTGYFDVTVSAECFEHNPFRPETLANMLRMTRPGGLVALSVATTGRPEHGTARTTPAHSPLTTSLEGVWPTYYRNLTDVDIRGAVHLPGWFRGFQFLLCASAQDLYFWGIRSGGVTTNEDHHEFRRQVLALDHALGAAIGTVTISHFTELVGFVPSGVVPSDIASSSTA